MLDARTLLAGLGCGLGASAAACVTSERGGSCTQAELIVAASDYSSSAVGSAPASGFAPLATGLDLGKDPILASSAGRVFLLARDNDLVFELDPRCGTVGPRLSVHDLAARGTANPHGLAVADDGALFVTLYNAPRIAVFKDGALERTLDTSSFDPDGNPQADAIRIVDVAGTPKAFVTLERLDDADRLRATRPASLLRIDVRSRTIETAIPLVGMNPFNTIVTYDGALFFAEPGNFDAADEPRAGVERFDPRTNTSAIFLPESALGGSVAELAIADGCGAAIVASPVKDLNPTFLVTFDPATGRVLQGASAPLFGPTPGYDLQGLAWKNGSLYAGDRRAAPQGFPVHVFDRAGAPCSLSLSSRTIYLAQPPTSLREAN